MNRAISRAGKGLMLSVARYSGAEWLRDRVWSAGSRLPASVLVFHRISDDIPEDGISMSSARFRWILERLKRDYRPAALAEIVQCLQAKKRWPPRTVAITFDDGYLDNFTVAAPILAELGIPATFFIAVNAIGSGIVFPWDEALAGRVPWMDWQHVRGLSEKGFEIGSHSLSHPHLSQLSQAEAEREIVDSKKALEDRIAAPIRLFAYPFGGPLDANREVRDLVMRAGYQCCCSAHGGFVLPSTDPFEMCRINPGWFSSPTELDFCLRSGAPWHWAQPRY